MIPTPWINQLSFSDDSTIRIFCFHHAGGSASFFKEWADKIPAYCELFAIQLPARENRFSEPPATDFEQLTDAIAQAMTPYLDRPYIVFGHSLGAIVSYGALKSLTKKNITPPILYIPSARHAPQLKERNAPLHNMSDKDLISALKEYNGIPEGLLDSVETAQPFLPRLKADFFLTETYEHNDVSSFDFPILAVGGKQDPAVNSEELNAWSSHTSSTFQAKQFECGHFYSEKSLLALIGCIFEEADWLLEMNRSTYNY